MSMQPDSAPQAIRQAVKAHRFDRVRKVWVIPTEEYMALLDGVAALWIRRDEDETEGA